MKIFSLILSIVVFAISGYFFVADLRAATEMNYLIYMSLLVILMLICVVGVMINLPMILKERRRMKAIIYNSYSKKRIANKSFDRQFEIL
jgi:membrane associated rhomboid family serine protease